MSKAPYNRGVTLIETVIYIALLGLLMAGVLGAVYQILQASASTSSHNTTQEEGHFLLRKIEWTLTGISSATVVSASELKTTKYDGTAVDIKLSSGVVTMQEGSGSFLPLSTPNVKVTSLQFVSIPALGTGPAGVSATIVIDGLTFSTTKYLRK